MNLKKMYNIVICGMLVLLIVTTALFVNFYSLVSRSRNLNQDSIRLITLSNDMLHVNNYLVKLMRLFVVNNDVSILDEYDAILNDYESLNGKLDKMVEIGLTANEEKQLDELLTLLDQLAEIEGSALEAYDNGDSETMASIIHGNEYADTDALLASKTAALISDITSRADTSTSDIQDQIELRINFLIIFITLSIFCFIALQIIQKNRILKPIEEIQTITERVSRGDIEIQIEQKHNDEVGMLIGRINDMVHSINEQCHVVERVAAGDLTVDLTARCDKDAMNFALIKMVDDLNKIFNEIAASTSQVNMGTNQIAGGAQKLAQGASEQVSAIGELSASVSQMTARSKENAEMADKAAALANTIKVDAEKGSSHMDRMVQAVQEIRSASQSIEKVMKVIDDIAFQTNILALNAAVEAARAGQHGKGFAVVAEEVRNLAAKSAEAAKDTGSLIANTMEKAELGARIAEETARSLTGIVSGIAESGVIISAIAKSTDAQNMAIAEINSGIRRVEEIIHQNSAATEESAAASEEMSGQADILNELVAQFKLKNSGRNRNQSLPFESGSGNPLSLTTEPIHKY